MDDDLEARLQSHSQAFEGLLSLIPAKEYYAKDNSDQWQAKKQTKEQKREAKKAKLDPANQKSAKDVMAENERKRKRELNMEDDDDNDEEPSAKKAMTDEEARKAKAEKRKAKREKKQDKIERKREKVEAKRAKKEDEHLDELAAERQSPNADESDDDAVDAPIEADDDVDHGLSFDGLADENNHNAPSESSTPASPDVNSPAFDTSGQQSTASSTSSIIPPTKAPRTANTNNKSVLLSQKQLPNTVTSSKTTAPDVSRAESQEALHARLRARIDLLRAKRKADGPDGQGARSRQDLLDSRRKKSDARKQHKKELRLKAKQEEERLNNERLSGSGSPLTTDLFSPRPQQVETNFNFGRIAFEDGQQVDSKLANLVDVTGGKRKGPQDTRTALEQAQKKAARINGLDETKRKDIESKDAWLNAKKRAHGERVRDDTSLLKKTLKRKEKAKNKSGQEWSERIEGVKKGQAARQKKREDNLRERKEGKGVKKGKKAGGAAKGQKKKKGRPGFEGK